MMNRHAGRNRAKTIGWCCLTLLAVLALCYANSFNAAWHYDDYPNILDNEKIHATKWSWQLVRQSFSAGLSHQAVSRPLAYLTFALNYRIGGTDVVGYHIVNFAVHWLSSVFLFLFIRLALRLPRLEGRYEQHGDWVALAATALWATHPIQVTAVTFVVQRMASMAGLFYVMTLYLYLKGRLCTVHRRRWGFFALGALTALCALMTKENAVLLFYAIWLFDLLLVQGVNWRNVTKNLGWALCLTLCIGLLGLLYTDPRNLFQPFHMRSFTWLERLMTQPRVLFFYLSLLAVPMTSRMSLVHDIEASTSLLMPWTTAASVAGLLILVGLLLWLARRYPLPSYCGLFFFLNHAIEGSIFNLELIYEHRNYIPSMLIFLPVAMGVSAGVRLLAPHTRLRWPVGFACLLLVASQMHTTFAYNQVFATRLALWSDVVVKYPRLSLGHLNLSKVFWEAGKFDRSAQQNRAALALDRFNNRYQKGLAHFNLGQYAVKVQHNPVLAAQHFEKAQSYIESPELWKKIAKSWMRAGEHRVALSVMEDAEGRWGGADAELFRMMGVSQLKLNRPEAARGFARKALLLIEDDTVSTMVVAQSYRMQGEFRRALKLCEASLSANPKSIIWIMALMELYQELGWVQKSAGMVGRLLAAAPAPSVKGAPPHIHLGMDHEQIEMMPYVPDMSRIKQLMASRQEHKKIKGEAE